MPRSELTGRLAAIDWRGWIFMAWVIWFGGQYARMVWKTKGAQVMSLARHLRGGSPEGAASTRETRYLPR